MNILHLICSPRGKHSESYRMSQSIVDLLLVKNPGAGVTIRMVGDGSISQIDTVHATALGATQAMPVELSLQGTMAQSEALIRELEAADIVVIGTPMHNFTVPVGLKAWIDHIVRVRRTFHVAPHGKIPALRDRPIYVAVSSGARYSGERARQPDFLTPYLQAILATIGLHDLTFFPTLGSTLSAEALIETRVKTDHALAAYFAATAPA